MIKLNKQNSPEILVVNQESWTEDLMGHISSGTEIPDSLKTRYNLPEIKDALREDSFSKCIYCESKVSHVAWEHIEHLKPKSKYPEDTFNWDNLGLACPVCNTNKGNFYDEELPFINPYKEDPSNHFRALGLFVYYISGDDRGELTDKKIKLNRANLIERRKERIDFIRILMDKYEKETNNNLKNIIKDEIMIEIDIDKPYSFCARSVFESLLR